MTAKLSQHAGGGELFTPAKMTFNGNYLTSAITAVSNTNLSMIVNFKIASFTGAGAQHLFRVAASSRIQCLCIAYSSDYATAGRQNTLAFYVQDSTGATACV